MWSAQIAVHFAHRAFALVVAAWIVANAVYVWRRHRERRELVGPATWLVGLVVVQATLGALVVLTAKQPVLNTLHVATGAIVLGTSLVITLRAFRVRFRGPARP